MPGVFLVREWAPIGEVIEDLIVFIACSLPGGWEGVVEFFPHR